jgi:hypothetical protein
VSQFKGTYVFKQNGLEIGRSTNLITNNGRKRILEYLAGSRQNWAADMAIGAMSTTPLVTDTQLNFETARYPVTLKSFISATNTDPDLIVVRSVLPSDLYANIYEVGLYAVTNGAFSTSTRNNVILSDFSNLTYWQATSGSTTTNAFVPQGYNSPRIGANSINIDSSTVYENLNLNIGFKYYTSADSLQILAFNTTAGNVTVTLTDITGKQQNIVFAVSDNTEYSILSVAFDQTTSGVNYSSIFNFDTITGISISTDSTASLTIDAIKVSSANEIGSEETIVSKSVLSNPIPKNPNIPLDIEYYVELL